MMPRSQRARRKGRRKGAVAAARYFSQWFWRKLNLIGTSETYGGSAKKLSGRSCSAFEASAASHCQYECVAPEQTGTIVEQVMELCARARTICDRAGAELSLQGGLAEGAIHHLGMRRQIGGLRFANPPYAESSRRAASGE
jgi:hypothetical protein